ncbi:caspase family protein [Streptomyces griseorubiginosus]|uniref:caspase, EACC1-associated type n=1 Tax=Streptomyces griseorubiginosus TaxID=67304 RepID=UPI00362F4EF9
MALPDPSTARAVIVGVQNYSLLESLPAVANNVARLSELLRDPGLWGLSAEHCRVLLDPASDREVLDAVHKAASEAEDTFLLYFAGHGLPDQPDGLQLALPDTSREHLYRALSYDRVRSVILGACKARHKVVILDTCFSGRALKGVMGPSGVADFAAVDGTFLMTSSAENRTSMAPPGARYTLFTGELVKVLEQGEPDAGDLLDMDTIYRAVDRALRAAGGPLPQQRARNAGARITFARNRAQIGPLVRPPSGAPTASPPPGYESLLDETVPGLVGQLNSLARSQRTVDADAVLTAVATRWPEQQTAALLVELVRVGMTREARLACEVVVGRPPRDVAACLHILDQLGAAPVVDAVSTALLAAGPAAVAGVARHVREYGHPMTERLIQAALTEAGPEGAADLLLALHRHDLGDRALELLRALVSEHPDPRYVRAADALVESGAAASAYRLYAILPTALAASRTAEETARLLRAMAESGERTLAETLLDGLIAVPGERGPADWALALHTQGLDWADAGARDVLARASVEEVLDLMERIRRTRPADLVTVVNWATHDGRSAADIVAFTAALRSYGLPLDALRILTETADSDLQQAAALISALRPERGDEASKLMDRACARTVAERVALVTALRGHGAREDAEFVLTGVMDLPAEQVLSDLPLLAREVDVETLYRHIALDALGEHLARLLLVYWQDGRHADGEQLLALIAARDPSMLCEALRQFMRGGLPTAQSMEQQSWLARTLPRLGVPTLVSLSVYAVMVERRVAGLVAETVVGMDSSLVLELIAALRGRSPGRSGPREAEPLIWVLGTALAGRADAPQLVARLREDSEHSTDELRVLLATGRLEHVTATYWLLARGGGSLDGSLLSALADRSDLTAVLHQLYAAGLSRGDAMRIRRASATPSALHRSKAVEEVIEQATGVHTATVLRDAGRYLQPHELAELLVVFAVSERGYDLNRVLDSVVQRTPLEDWMPEVLAVLGGARLDGLAGQLIRKVVRRSRVSDVERLVKCVRQEGMTEQADLLEEANGRGRLTRWL